jgi:hypothetical protein
VKHCYWLGVPLLLACILSACGGAPIPRTTAGQAPPLTSAPTESLATPTPTVAPPTATPVLPTPTAAPSPIPSAAPATTAGDFKPLDPTVCNDLTDAMAQTLGVEVTPVEVPFEDHVTRQTGTGCQATATGTGRDFDFGTVTNSLWAMLVAQGWQEDIMYGGGGATGLVGGFRKDNGLCLLVVEWKPSQDVNCPPDKPIFECQLTPEQQLYTIRLNCAQSVSSQPHDAGPVTTVIHYTPQVPAGESREGSCWTNSIAAPRADAWRCTVGNEIFDPCFELDDSQGVVCDANPITGQPGFKLKLTETLPAPEVPAEAANKGWGWLIELADGTVCGPATGATFPVDGEPATYYCTGTPSEGKTVVIAGDLQVGPTWMAEKAIVSQGESGIELEKSEMMAIRTVWQ